MTVVWVQNDVLSTLRIDAEFHGQPYVDHERFVSSVAKNGPTPISTLATFGKLSTGPFGSLLPASLYRSEGHPLFRVQNVVPFFPATDNLVYLDEESHAQLRRSAVKPGFVLISKAGRVGDACVVPSNWPECNITEHIIALEPNVGVDPYFIVAALESKFVKTQAVRFGLGTLINYLGVEATRTIKIPSPDPAIQRAIGNKVRKAERLRELAARAQKNVYSLIDEGTHWRVFALNSARWTWIAPADMDSRLDGKFNSPDRISLIRHCRQHGIRLARLGDVAEVTAMIGWKGLTAAHYVEEGPYLIRGVDFQDGYFNFEKMLRVDRNKFIEQPQIHVQPGDVALTKDGTIGKALTIPDLPGIEACVGSTVARLRPYRESVSSYALEALINHPIVGVQIASLSTGLAQPHITQEWINELLVPQLDYEEDIAHLTIYHHSRATEAFKLVSAARTDVEALIDGTLDEAALLAEGEAIEQWLAENPSPHEMEKP